MERSQVPIPNPVAVLRRGADGWAILFNPDTADAIAVNPVGVVLWRLLDGRRSLEDVLQAARRRFADAPDALAGDVAAFVEDLAARGLVGYEQETPALQAPISEPPPLEDGAQPIVPATPAPAAHGPDGVLFFAHRGSSMNPTLDEADLLEVAPYGGRPVRVGDVIAIAPPGGDHLIVHRVVRVTPDGVCTRGDNNAGEDGWCLQPAQIVGRAVAAWRGHRRRRVAGGWAGCLWARLVRTRRLLDQALSALLRPAYHGLARSGIVRRLTPPFLRPRLVVFGTGEKARPRLLLGRRVVGQYDALRQCWHIRRPFRLFLDET